VELHDEALDPARVPHRPRCPRRCAPRWRQHVVGWKSDAVIVELAFLFLAVVVELVISPLVVELVISPLVVELVEIPSIVIVVLLLA